MQSERELTFSKYEKPTQLFAVKSLYLLPPSSECRNRFLLLSWSSEREFLLKWGAILGKSSTPSP
jgi:hypothetical protein